MAFLVSHLGMLALYGWAGYQLIRPSKKKQAKPSTPTPQPQEPKTCGFFVWNARDVDVALDNALDTGERDPDALSLIIARAVYATAADGRPQIWPAAETDEPAQCIYAWIIEHVQRRLTELDDDPPRGPLTEPTEPTEPPPPRQPTTVDPQPVILGPWTDPGNYPTPGMFHQIGGENSGTSLQVIARKALTTAFYLALNDLDRARDLAHVRDNWEYYREAINCVPWNHALFGSANKVGTSGYYPTPHGDSISMYPVHAKVADAMARGEVPARRVHTGERAKPSGGRHAFPWLPLLDVDALRDGRVVLSQEVWPDGVSVVHPPPEVRALGIANLPFDRTWGCLGHEQTTEELSP